MDTGSGSRYWLIRAWYIKTNVCSGPAPVRAISMISCIYLAIIASGTVAGRIHGLESGERNHGEREERLNEGCVWGVVPPLPGEGYRKRAIPLRRNCFPILSSKWQVFVHFGS